MSVGTKYSFMNIKGSSVHAAVGLEADFAGGLGSDGAREDNHEVEPFLAVAVDLPARLQAFFHVGKSVTVGGRRQDDQLVDEPSTSVQWNAGGLMGFRHTTLALELGTHTDGSPWRQGTESYVTPSITFLLPRPWEVGVGVPIGLGSRSDRFALAVHLIYEK